MEVRQGATHLTFNLALGCCLGLGFFSFIQATSRQWVVLSPQFVQLVGHTHGNTHAHFWGGAHSAHRDSVNEVLF